MILAESSRDLNQIVRTQINVIDLARVKIKMRKKRQFHIKRMKKLNGNKSHVR